MVTNEIRRIKDKLKLLDSTELPVKQLLIDFHVFAELYPEGSKLEDVINDYRTELVEFINTLTIEDKKQQKLW